MADPKKGFDPLASLFDGPDLRDFEGAPLPEVDDYDVPFEAQPEHTDPLISLHVDGVPLARLESGETHAPAPHAPVPSRALDAPDPGMLGAQDSVDELPLVPPEPEPELEPPAAVEALPEPQPEEEAPTEPEVDKAALARILARAAMAKAAASQPKPSAKPHGAKTEGLRKAQKAQARRIPPPPEEDEAPAAAPKKKKAKKSRLDGLAARARRPKSALEAAREAAAAEDEKREQAQVAHLLALPLRVQGILRRQLTGMSKVEVANALVMSDRPLLRALWKGHRARFAASGQLSEVVATTNVIRALSAVGPGQLVAAIVETEQSDYLVWVDVGSEAVIAAFPDARAWYAASRK